MIWNVLKLALWTESPVVVVLSGSMEPSMQRGDILFLHKLTPIEVGDIVVYTIEGEGIPIVHRVTIVQKNNDGSLRYLTKGDNNPVDDRGLYPRGQFYLTEKQIVGKVAGIFPYGGYLTILLNDYPMFKYALIAVLAIFVLTAKE